MGEDAAVPVNPPGDEVTVYSVIGSPLEAGVGKETMASPDPPRAHVTSVGAAGTVAGTMDVEGKEGAEVPTPLVAVRVKV